jgi:hypothetical protein
VITRFDGKVAVVTGAASGLAQLPKRVANCGARLNGQAEHVNVNRSRGRRQLNAREFDVRIQINHLAVDTQRKPELTICVRDPPLPRIRSARKKPCVPFTCIGVSVTNAAGRHPALGHNLNPVERPFVELHLREPPQIP